MLRGLLQADAAPTGSVTDPSQIDVLYRQPLDRSEDTMPNSARWWADKTEEYAGWLRQESGLSDGYLRRNRRYLVAFRRDRERAGIAPPEGPTDVGREHIRAAKGCGLWGPRKLKTKFSVLRGFLRWAGNPLSDGKNPAWRLPSGCVDRRKWVDRADLLALCREADGRRRVRVVLRGSTGFESARFDD